MTIRDFLRKANYDCVSLADRLTDVVIGKTLASNHVRIFDLRGSYGRQTVGFRPSTFWRT